MSPPSDGDGKAHIKMEEDNPKLALTPPTSEGTKGNQDDTGSELSDIEPEEPASGMPEPQVEDEGDIVPDHYYDGGKVPVFKPTMDQFRSFKGFIAKIDKYGMKSGIVKVIPPKEWRDLLPPLDEKVKTIKVKNPITQEFHGTHGTYTQANIEKQRSYNLPQWKALCEESNHQPPAKRGERRRNQEKPARAPPTRTRNAPAATGRKKGPGRPRIRPLPTETRMQEAGEVDTEDSIMQGPPTPTSPPLKAKKPKKETKKVRDNKSEEPRTRGRQPKSVGSRRLHNRRDQVDVIDEEAFRGFDYRIHNQNEWTTERVQELETAYWRSLNFNNPMYGADMPGSLFEDSTKEWNVARLENLLDVLGQNVPGVNTAYLYLGMWKASFAWHLEDVDLYSINYIHFGAPKQWYSISQEDARRFESAMKSVWPTDAKNCDQFLRHKTYLISPQLLQSQFNIKVNRLVHNEGEFVITFPYGYHSGYNLGYNCAESVNFATDAWLDYGKVARKCHCEADSVWVDVREIERKLRGEPTPEYYEETDEEEDDEDEDDTGNLPTPPGSVKGKAKRSHKRKRDPNEKEGKSRVKKLKIRIKAPTYEPCILCPNDNKYEELLSTDDGRRAHRRCGMYTPETHISEQADGSSMVRDIVMIDKARLELKCNYCRSKKGAVFQCSQKKCTRAYHATCAMPAGIQIDIGPTSVWGDDGTEYVDTGFDFRCRVHRSKRSKNADSLSLENNEFIHKKASKLSVGEAVQAQFYQGDIFAGNVVENRKSEQMVLLEILPKGAIVELEWKWLLIFDPANSQLPMPSENAKPLPADLLRKSRTTAEDPAAKIDGPKADEPFCDPDSIYKWSEFDSCRPFHNENQVKIDLSQPDKFWYFIGELSTDAKAYYTHNPAIRVNNPKGNFLEVEKLAQLAAEMKALREQKPYSTPYGTVNQHALNAARASNSVGPAGMAYHSSSHIKTSTPKERGYHGKYAITDPISPPQYRSTYGINVDAQALQNQRIFQNRASMGTSQSYRPNHYPYDRQTPAQSFRPPLGPTGNTAPTAPMMSASPQQPAPLPYQPPTGYNFNVRGLLRKVQMAADSPQRYPPQHQTTQPQKASTQPQQPPGRPQAPVANMMTVPQPDQESANRPQLEERQTSDSDATLAKALPSASLSKTPSLIAGSAQTKKGVSHLDVADKHFYLHEAERMRPQVYQSPYAVGGGFTEAYLPAPTVAAKTRPRGPSISEEYLLKQDASQQERVTTKMGEDKAKLLQRQCIAIQRRRSINQQHQPQSPFCKPHQHDHSQTSHLRMSAFQQPTSNGPDQDDSHVHSYFDPNASPSYETSTTYPDYTNSTYHTTYNSNHPQPPHQHNQHRTHYSQSPHDHYVPDPPHYPPTSTLTFQSPHDFQAQMQREAYRSPTHESAFDRISQELKSVATNGHDGGGGHQGQWHDSQRDSAHRLAGSGQAGSPLKREFGNGGEMLPMMP
ncbi:MAG: hypothetical protein Q9217_002235 [Psora testacea]